MGRYDARGRLPVYVRRVARDFASGRWLKTKGTSPMTQEPLDAEDLVPQHIVRKLIDSFLDSKRRRRES